MDSTVTLGDRSFVPNDTKDPEERKRGRERALERGRAALVRLLDYAKDQGISRAELAEAAGIDDSTIRGYFAKGDRARGQPLLGNAILMAERAGVSLDFAAGRPVAPRMHLTYLRDTDSPPALNEALEQHGPALSAGVIAAARRSDLQLTVAGWIDYLDDLQRCFDAARARATRAASDTLQVRAKR